MTLHSLFVYGSLKKGFGNHSFLDDSLFVCKGITLANLVLQDLGSFPAILLQQGESGVHGEIYKVIKSYVPNWTS